MNQIGELRSDIESQVEGFLAAFHRRDAAGVAALYTEGARLLPQNADMITGRQGIQAVWQGMIDSGVKEASLEILELEPMGDKAVYDIDKYHLKRARKYVEKPSRYSRRKFQMNYRMVFLTIYHYH